MDKLRGAKTQCAAVVQCNEVVFSRLSQGQHQVEHTAVIQWEVMGDCKAFWSRNGCNRS